MLKITREILESPEANAPVALLIELKVPEITFLKRDFVPLIIPLPPSENPFPKPSLGFWYISTTPAEIFLKRPTGFPTISKDPNNLKTFLAASSLYLLQFSFGFASLSQRHF